MYCSKCKYTSFDNLDKCPKCGEDWTELKKKINLEWVGHNATPWLEIGEDELASAKDNKSNIISGFDADEDIDFSFDENEAGEDLEEMLTDTEEETEEKRPSEENIIDYFGEEEGTSQEPVLEFGLDEFENQESQNKDGAEEEIDISQLEWEEDELDTQNMDSSPEASPSEESESTEGETELGDLDLEGIEISETDIPPKSEEKSSSGDTYTDLPDSEDLGIDLAGDEQSGETQLSQVEAEAETPSPEDLDEDELLMDLSTDNEGENNREETSTNEDTEEKDNSSSAELDGDIDYPELDLFEEEK